MKAAVLYELGGRMAMEDVELDGPGHDEVLIRVIASGVCHSDLHQLRGDIPGPVPIILGHEGAGVVEDVGPGVSHVAAGDHVVLSWIPFCGRCRFCARGRYSICENLGWSEDGFMTDGTVRFHREDTEIHHCVATSTFTEFTVVPSRCAIKVDSEVPFAELAVLGCAVLTGVGAIVNAAAVRPDETVAVIGCGGVGLSAVMGAAMVNAKTVIAIDTNPASLDLAFELGATHTVNPADGPVTEAAAEISPQGIDHAIEAIGKQQTLQMACDLLGRGGVATLLGMAAGDAKVTVDPLQLTVEERRVQGSFYGSSSPFADIPMLVNLIKSGRLPVKKLLKTRPLEEVNEAISELESGVVGRTVLLNDETAALPQ